MRARLMLMIRASIGLLVLSVSACQVSTSGGASGPSPKAVAIVVIDDFDVPDPGTTFAKADPDKPDNCVVTSMGSQVAGGKGASGNDPPAGTSHGKLVVTELQQELGKLHMSQVTAGQPGWYDQDAFTPRHEDWISQFEIWRGSKNDPEILLVGVDTNQYRTTEVASHITDLTSGMKMPSGSGKNLVGFVLNMSFEIVPCEFLPASVNVGPETLRLARYLEIINAAEGVSDLERTLAQLVGTDEANLMQKLQEAGVQPSGVPIYQSVANDIKEKSDTIVELLQKKPDPVQATLTGSSTGVPVIPVAAAGNGLGADHVPLSFPFAPGIWDSVVSVSAGDKTKAAYSNSGEVELSGDLDYPDPTATPPDWSGYGTSFAAPRLSVLESYYLVHHGAVTCPGNPDSVPPLGYHETAGWGDKTVPDAAAYCTNFQTLAVYP